MGTGTKFRILTVRGIPLYVSVSFLVLAAFIVLLNWSVLSSRTDEVVALIAAAVEFILLFAIVLIHEAAHAVTARGFDVPVAGITLTGWGGATETPADSRGPLAEFLIAAAGPFSTLVLAGILSVVAGALGPGDAREVVERIAELNLYLALLNVIPGYPLDGGRMLEAVAWAITKQRTMSLRIAGWAGIVVGVGFIIYALQRFQETGSAFGSIWLGFIGLVLIGVGRAMPQRIAIRQRLAGATVGEAMRPPGGSIAANTSLSEALDDYLRPYPDRAFPVVQDGRVIGVVSMATARRTGSRDPLRPVRDAMRPLNQVVVLSPDAALEDAWEWLGGRDGLVLQDGVFVGMLGPPDVDSWARGERRLSMAIPPRPDL